MNKSTTRILIAVLLLVLAVVLWSGLEQKSQEYFTDGSDAVVKSPIGDVDLSQIPDPATAIQRVRALLDKYDNAGVWDHAAKVMDKDPGQLAREALGIRN